jgi:hypothetical protein
MIHCQRNFWVHRRPAASFKLKFGGQRVSDWSLGTKMTHAERMPLRAVLVINIDHAAVRIRACRHHMLCSCVSHWNNNYSSQYEITERIQSVSNQ